MSGVAPGCACGGRAAVGEQARGRPARPQGLGGALGAAARLRRRPERRLPAPGSAYTTGGSTGADTLSGAGRPALGSGSARGGGGGGAGTSRGAPAPGRGNARGGSMGADTLHDAAAPAGGPWRTAVTPTAPR